MATKKATKQQLSQAYTFNGITYGPGNVEVPGDFPDVSEKEEAFKAAKAGPARAAQTAPAEGESVDEGSDLTKANLGTRHNAVNKDGSVRLTHQGNDTAIVGGVPNTGGPSREELEKLNKADLKDLAEQRGVTVEGDTKADYVDALAPAGA